jgi:hypothetical protein
MEVRGQFQVPTALTPRKEYVLAVGNESGSEGIGYKCNYYQHVWKHLRHKIYTLIRTF